MSVLLQRWREPNGYKDVLAVSLPLVVSMGSITLMQFTDRLFLGHYSLDAIAAATPAGILSFLFLSFFFGTAEYVSVFIAQYTGMGKPHRVGQALWQGIHFALAAWVLLLACTFLGDAIFTWADHPPEVQVLERTYFRILMLGSGVVLLQVVLSCFYSGRGLTRTVMLVNLLAACVNIPLDYVMINGLRLWGLQLVPEMGIAGAALATVVAWVVMLVSFGLLLFTRKNEQAYGVRSAWRPDRELFGRLMRYGLPGGAQFFMDIFAVTFFVFMIGRLGTVELAATNIVFALHGIVFLPMIGFSIGASILVGQALGGENPDDAHRAVMNTLHMTLVSMGCMAVVFLTLPELLAGMFQPRDLSPGDFAPIVEATALILRIVAVFCLFDGVAMVFFGALKGAGDTRFVMLAMAALSVGVVVGPVYLAVEILGSGYLLPWLLLTLYIILLSVVLGLRYRNGAWRDMRVVGEWERSVPAPTEAMNAAPQGGAGGERITTP